MKKEHCAGTYAKAMAFACLLFVLPQSGCAKPVVQPGVVQNPTPGPAIGVVTVTPEPTPTQTDRNGPENTPVPTMTPVPTKTPVASPVPTKEVHPTSEPITEVTPTEKPTPTEGVKEEGQITPEPLPTGAPDYNALLQSGWQRAEDFFGNREIIFPGWLNQTRLFADEGRYEYRYMSQTDDGILFYIIGEADTAVQPFLDGLEQSLADCMITAEAEEDYAYTYTDGSLFVKGRVYACYNEDVTNRMRVELHYSADQLQTEGYEFYLK